MPETTSPDVSVIMPTYNSARFVRQSVATVLGQRGVNAELIVVDDQGTDETRAILEDIRKDNPDKAIKLIYRGRGLGQATARNAGISAAGGRYIALLDSDDHFDNPDVLRKWVDYADRLQLDMAGGQFFAEKDGKRAYSRTVEPTGERAVSIQSEPALANVTSCWQFLYRRSFLEATNTIFSPRLRQREDRLFLLEAMLKADRIGIMPDMILCKNHREDSSFRQIDRNQVEQYVQHLRELNLAFENARRQGRSSQEFETANSAIYLASLAHYWRKFYLHLSKDEDSKELLADFRAEYRKLTQGSGIIFRSKLLSPVMYAPADTNEGVIDVLRLAFEKDDDDLIHRILSKERLTIEDLRPLVPVSPDAEEIVCRYLSFHRNQFSKTRLKPGTKPLSRLVERIIFHVGAPKTGTSSLQHTLERNRLRLIEHGFHYPITGAYREKDVRRERTPGHASLLSRLLEGDKSALRELGGEIEALGRPVHTLILSSENIVSERFWNEGAGFQSILDLLGVSKVEVACLLRRQDDWVDSWYREMCANPWNRFTASPSDFFTRLESTGILDFENVLKTLSAPSQVSRVHVEAFEKVRGNGGTVQWFIDTFGMSSIDWQPADASLANESLSEGQAALMLLCKLNLGLTRTQLADAFRRIAASPNPPQVSSYLVPDEVMDEFRTRHAEKISYYCSRFGVGSDIRRKTGANPGALAVPRELFDLVRSADPDTRPGDRKARGKSTASADAPKAMAENWRRRAFVPLLKPLIRRVSKERAAAKFERDPRGYFRDIKSPFPRRLGLLLFP
jgi:succinoglycan biosynthesis protein ExoO